MPRSRTLPRSWVRPRSGSLSHPLPRIAVAQVGDPGTGESAEYERSPECCEVEDVGDHAAVGVDLYRRAVRVNKRVVESTVRDHTADLVEEVRPDRRKSILHRADRLVL